MVTILTISILALIVYFLLSAQRSAAKAHTRKLQSWD